MRTELQSELARMLGEASTEELEILLAANLRILEVMRKARSKGAHTPYEWFGEPLVEQDRHVFEHAREQRSVAEGIRRPVEGEDPHPWHALCRLALRAALVKRGVTK